MLTMDCSSVCDSSNNGVTYRSEGNSMGFTTEFGLDSSLTKS